MMSFNTERRGASCRIRSYVTGSASFFGFKRASSVAVEEGIGSLRYPGTDGNMSLIYREGICKVSLVVESVKNADVLFFPRRFLKGLTTPLRPEYGPLTTIAS